MTSGEERWKQNWEMESRHGPSSQMTVATGRVALGSHFPSVYKRRQQAGHTTAEFINTKPSGVPQMRHQRNSEDGESHLPVPAAPSHLAGVLEPSGAQGQLAISAAEATSPLFQQRASSRTSRPFTNVAGTSDLCVSPHHFCGETSTPPRNPAAQGTTLPAAAWDL